MNMWIALQRGTVEFLLFAFVSMVPSSLLPLDSLEQLQPWFTLFCILVAIAVLVLHFFPSGAKLPPGPPKRPLVGHLFMVRSRLQKGHLGDLAMDLHRKYGPIITLWFGLVPIIVISGTSIAHEALVRRGLLFGSRPAIHSEPVFTKEYHYINSAPYGPFWQSVRRNIVSVMLQPARVKTFKSIRDTAIRSVIERLMGEAALRDGEVEFFSNCRRAVFEILLFMCFGWQMEDSMASCLDDVQHLVFKSQSDLILGQNIFDRRRYIKERGMLREKLKQLSVLAIEEYRTRKRDGQVFPGSYIETLFALEANEGGKKLTDIQILTLCSEFISAGTDPTAICLEWTMANLVLHRDVQARCYAEIEHAVGNRPVEEEEVEKLPFLKAIITETLRLHPPGHFTLPHAVTQPCKLAGYDIPMNALISVHLAAISSDPSIWVDPKQFRPERFLHRETDMTGSKQVEMIPFGAGWRICPGKGLAMMHAGVFLARMLQVFEWSSAMKQGGKAMDMSEKSEFTVLMKMRTPLRARIQKRSSSSSSSSKYFIAQQIT